MVHYKIDIRCFRWFTASEGGEFFEREYEFYLKFGAALTSLVVLLATCLTTVAAAHIIKVSLNIAFIAYIPVVIFFAAVLKLSAQLFLFLFLYSINFVSMRITHQD